MSRASQTLSTALHLIFILFLLLWSTHPEVLPRVAAIVPLFAPHRAASPSGGSGMRQPEPPRKGELPQRITRIFQPPIIQQVDFVPKLTLPMAVEGPPQLTTSTSVIGLPDGIGDLSGGPGGPLGLGKGRGGAPGDGRGNHHGDGDYDAVFSPGQGASLPVPVRIVEPEYSEPARKVRLSGSVLVYAEIDPNGRPRNVHVIRGLGMGLDEKALSAVSEWLFKPGMKDGRAVTVRATFEVNFRLL